MTADRPDDRKRWLALDVLCVGVLMIVLDTTIVNVALPSIASSTSWSRPTRSQHASDSAHDDRR